MKDNATGMVKVTYYSSCLGDGPMVQTNKCDGLKVGTLVSFTAKIEVCNPGAIFVLFFFCCCCCFYSPFRFGTKQSRHIVDWMSWRPKRLETAIPDLPRGYQWISHCRSWNARWLRLWTTWQSGNFRFFFKLWLCNYSLYSYIGNTWCMTS